MVKERINKKLILAKILAPLLVLLGGILCINIALKVDKDGVEVKIEYTPNNDLGETDEIPTVESIDGGGKFQDTMNVDGAEPALYYELGSLEDVDTSSPEAFKDSTLGRCIVAGNYWGAQCVSLSRAFWFDYAGYDVSTCGTGLAKGMMNCYEDNARDKFKVIWNTNEIQDGTWIVLDGKTTGHICMALGKVTNGYVQCLGENQGGAICDYGIGGAATNIINISVKDFIGGYTPLTYIKQDPIPIAPDTGINQ